MCLQHRLRDLCYPEPGPGRGGGLAPLREGQQGRGPRGTAADICVRIMTLSASIPR